jgi:hypothetical protein
MSSVIRRPALVRSWISSVRWPLTARVLVGVVGLALLALGAREFAAAASSGGTVTVMAAGAVLLISPFILDRVQRVSV